ncbi:MULTISPECIES: hypothetical protein [Oscillibacter]|uniref:hypothetical protein n=1 Tax=Oscillibacter TaxID=459786 RepID=UPI0028996704|nr:hypothetical protein [Oscillibacter sp.]
MKKSTALGIDGMNFQLELIGADKSIFMDRHELKNLHSVDYATVEVEKGILFVYVNAPQIFRKDNIYPCSVFDLSGITDIKDSLICDLQRILDENRIYCDVSKSILKRIECGITSKVVGDCTASQVQELMNRSFDKVKVYQRTSKKCLCRKENESSYWIKKGYYEFKAYDKSLEEREKGNFDVESGLLRIEVAFQMRTIKRLFGVEPTFENIFSEEGFIKVIKEFCRVFSEEVIEQYIKLCLIKLTNTLFEFLTETDSPTETLARHRDIVLDEVVLRRALKKWYALRGKPDNSRQAIHDLQKYDLPRDVVKTLKKFHKLCI